MADLKQIFGLRIDCRGFEAIFKGFEGNLKRSIACTCFFIVRKDSEVDLETLKSVYRTKKLIKKTMFSDNKES